MTRQEETFSFKDNNHSSNLSFKISKPIDINRKILDLAIIATLIIFSASFLQHQNSSGDQSDFLPKSKYFIENLKGDSINTYVHWEIIPDEPLYVNIKNPANLSEEKIQLVKDVILSTESFEADKHKISNAPKGTKSKYYVGWQGALSEIKQETKHPIPKSFEIISTNNSAGEIIITFTNMIDTDGSIGVTKGTTYGNQILKSEITIYNASSLSDRALMQVVRHEMGHALGLGHSSASEDLMHPQITTPLPFISECNVSAIIQLYDGKTNDEVICEI